MQLRNHPRLKRSAQRQLASIDKRQRLHHDTAKVVDTAEPWIHGGTEQYSNLQHMVDTPMGRTILKGLHKKGMDLRYLCSEFCSAAVEEGSTRFQTKVMAGITKESRFHARLAASLPKVKTVSLPIVVRKKILYRKFSPSAYVDLLPMYECSGQLTGTHVSCCVPWTSTDNTSQLRCGSSECLVYMALQRTGASQAYGLWFYVPGRPPAVSWLICNLRVLSSVPGRLQLVTNVPCRETLT